MIIIIFAPMKCMLYHKGQSVPDWYLEEEGKYLEIISSINELERKRDSIRQAIREKMVSEGLKQIDSGVTCARLQTVTKYRRVDLNKLKRKYPFIYEVCLERDSRISTGLNIKLK